MGGVKFTILAGQDPTPSSDRREVLLQVPLIDAHLLLSRRGSVYTQVSDLLLAIILWFTLLISNGRKERAQIWPNVSPLSFPEITFGPGLEENRRIVEEEITPYLKGKSQSMFTSTEIQPCPS